MAFYTEGCVLINFQSVSKDLLYDRYIYCVRKKKEDKYLKILGGCFLRVIKKQLIKTN